MTGKTLLRLKLKYATKSKPSFRSFLIKSKTCPLMLYKRICEKVCNLNRFWWVLEGLVKGLTRKVKLLLPKWVLDFCFKIRPKSKGIRMEMKST